MKAYIICVMVLLPFLVFGQTRPTIKINPTTKPIKKAMTQPTSKPIRTTTSPGKRITSKPSTSQASTSSTRTAPANISTFTDGSPYIDLSTFANSITAEDLREHLTILASDEFEGRETGTKGNRMAANYISQHFESLNLPRVGENHSYFQKVSFFKHSWNKLSVMANDETMRNMSDFFAFPSTNEDMPSIKADEIVFMGYGIDDDAYSDYKGKNVNGKVLLVYGGEPKDASGKYYVSNTSELSKWSNFKEKLQAAKRNGAKAILIIDGEIKKTIGQNRNTLLSSRLQLGEAESANGNFTNNLFVSPGMAQKLIGRKFKKIVKARKKIEAKGKSKMVKIPSDLEITMDKAESSLKGDNVLGYIEGVDPKLKDELVVITAHYDHLGKRGEDIYNGADDNGSGTSTVLEVAEAFANAKKAGVGPRRSVLVMLVTGEEKGLLGSKYYSEYPIYSLDKTVANINVDMVGRVDKKYEQNPNYIYVIGADRLSTELHSINEAANTNNTQLTLDYTYNAESDPNRYYYRSDHYNFAEKGIPAIFYFNGTHDDYHMISDTVEKINFEKMEKIGRLVFATAWELVNRDKRIEVDVMQK